MQRYLQPHQNCLILINANSTIRDFLKRKQCRSGFCIDLQIVWREKNLSSYLISCPTASNGFIGSSIFSVMACVALFVEQACSWGFTSVAQSQHGIPSSKSSKPENEASRSCDHSFVVRMIFFLVSEEAIRSQRRHLTWRSVSSGNEEGRLQGSLYHLSCVLLMGLKVNGSFSCWRKSEPERNGGDALSPWRSQPFTHRTGCLCDLVLISNFCRQ